MPKKKILCLVGPSGCGKSTLLEAIFDQVPQIWSHTTRPLRNEADKRHYIPEHELIAKIRDYQFCQAVRYQNNWYALRSSFFEETFRTRPVAAVDCVQEGLIQLRKSGLVPEENVLGCFVVVDPQTLLQRLTQRGESSAAIFGRLLQARREVLRYAHNPSLYNLIIVNDKLDSSLTKLKQLATGASVESDPFCVGDFLKEIDKILTDLQALTL